MGCRERSPDGRPRCHGAVGRRRPCPRRKARPRLRPGLDLRPVAEVRAAHAAPGVGVRGIFLLDAAAAVRDQGPTSGDPADDLLELLDAHLVQLDGSGEGEPRFMVPEPVRSSARRRLAESTLDEATPDRHAMYLLNRARAGGEVVRRAWPDIAAALDHELDHGRFDDALATAVALAPEVQEVPGAVASLEERITEVLAPRELFPARLRAQA